MNKLNICLYDFKICWNFQKCNLESQKCNLQREDYFGFNLELYQKVLTIGGHQSCHHKATHLWNAHIYREILYQRTRTWPSIKSLNITALSMCRPKYCAAFSLCPAPLRTILCPAFCIRRLSSMERIPEAPLSSSFQHSANERQWQEIQGWEAGVFIPCSPPS